MGRQQECNLVGKGSQEQRFGSCVFACPERPDAFADSLIAVANWAGSNEPAFDRVGEVREGRTVFSNARGKQDGASGKSHTVGAGEEAPVIHEPYGVDNPLLETGPVEPGLQTHVFQQGRPSDPLRKPWLVMA